MKKSHKIILGVVFLLVIVPAIGLSYFDGGKYKSIKSGAVIEFTNGNFIENGENLGSYFSFFNIVRVHIRMGHVQSIGYGRIFSDYIVLDFPSYGPAKLELIDPSP